MRHASHSASDAASAPTGREILRRLVRQYVGNYRVYLAAAVVCMVIAASLTALNAYMIRPVLDEIFVNKNAQMLTLVPLAIIAIGLVAGVADYVQSILMRYVGQKIVADMQCDLFAHLLQADLSTFHDHASGRLVSRFTNDIQLLRQTASHVLVGFAKELLTLLFLLAVMVWQSWELSLVAFSVLVGAVLPILRMGKRMRKVADATQHSLGDFTQMLDETFLGVRVVKAYGREEFETSRMRQHVHGLHKLYMRAAKISSAIGPMMEALGFVAIAAIIWYGGSEVMRGQTTPGAFFSFITAMIMAYRPVKVVASLNTQLQEGLAAASRFFDVMDKTPEIRDAEAARPLVISGGQLEFRQVSFHYPQASDDAVRHGIDDVSFVVPAGKTVALVGASGGGKSTIMNLLLRFYQPQDGQICIDGQPIAEVTLHSLRQATALVSQEVVLFDDTVRANLAYGRLGATDDEIMCAATQAHAHEFITRLPQGYDTVIGPQGVKLSGGQRQRISIARAILKNAPILLLDEATSALDTTSERVVQEALKELMQGRTTLVIAHRLSTIQHADSILVLDKGRLVEQGSHPALLARGGVYARLYSSSADAATKDV